MVLVVVVAKRWLWVGSSGRGGDSILDDGLRGDCGCGVLL